MLFFRDQEVKAYGMTSGFPQVHTMYLPWDKDDNFFSSSSLAFEPFSHTAIHSAY